MRLWEVLIPLIYQSILKNYRRVQMFQRMNIQYQVDEVKFIKIQSLIQKEKPTPNDIKKLLDDLINDNFKRTNNVRR